MPLKESAERLNILCRYFYFSFPVTGEEPHSIPVSSWQFHCCSLLEVPQSEKNKIAFPFQYKKAGKSNENLLQQLSEREIDI